MRKLIFGIFIFVSGCSSDVQQIDSLRSIPSTQESYFDNTGRTDVLSGGVRMIPIQTPVGDFYVWTKRIGNNPEIKVLILHGGPGATHELYEAFDSFLPGAGIEYYYYDQLGSHYSDQPDNMTDLLTTERFVEEVEQVRVALGLNKENFFLYGQSWGGLLSIEYALKYQNNLKGLIVSNMMASIPDYVRYSNEVLAPKLDPEVLAEIRALEAKQDFSNPRYVELVETHYYTRHVLRMPLDEWPDPVKRGFAHINPDVYVPMQGPSEFGASGILENWDRKADLVRITVPTLVIGAEYDTMDPKHMRWMSNQLPKGRYLYCPKGSHMAMYDDQETYFNGLIQFMTDVNQELM